MQACDWIGKKIGEYRVRISYANERMCQRFDILKRNQVVFRDLGIDNHYFLGAKSMDYDKHFMMKLTGHGKQLVVSKWTGGVHCCTSLLIFDLGNEFKEISEIYGGNFDPEIIDFNHDGIPEILITDDFLSYRFSSFANSAKGAVILKFFNGKYVPAEEMMKHPPPSEESWEKKIPAWRKALVKKGPEWPPESFIQTLTDLD